MSIFSSLSYLLKQASVGIHQTVSTEPPSNLLPVDSTPRENVSRMFGSESSNMNSTTVDEYLQFTLGAGVFTSTADINSSFDTSSIKLSNLSSLPTSISKSYFETEDAHVTESVVRFPDDFQTPITMLTFY